MIFNELHEALKDYESSLYVMIGKDENNLYIGNRYCMVSAGLVEDLDTQQLGQLPKVPFSLKKLLKYRANLLEKESGSKFVFSEALKKRNVIGVSQRLCTLVKLDVNSELIVTVNSALKLADKVSIDKRFSNLFKEHTFWYHPKDTTVFVIRKGVNKIDGVLVTVTLPKVVSKKEKTDVSETIKTYTKCTTCK